MTYLFVVAHPDDEVLGAGALIHKLHRSGERVVVYVLNTVDTTRYHDEPSRLREDLMASGSIIGAETMTGSFEDSEFHNASHRKMVQQIESVIAAEEPDFIFTHHPADVNSDHYWCFQSVQEAARYGQRGRYAADPIKGLYLMEVQSSTDWGVNAAHRPFEPNTFVDVQEQDIIIRTVTALMGARHRLSATSQNAPCLMNGSLRSTRNARGAWPLRMRTNR